MLAPESSEIVVRNISPAIKNTPDHDTSLVFDRIKNQMHAVSPLPNARPQPVAFRAYPWEIRQ